EHQKIAAGFISGQFTHIAARGYLLEAEFRGIDIGANGRSGDVEEVEKLAVFVYRGDNDPDSFIFNVHRNVELAFLARWPRHPADQLREELFVARPRSPLVGPALAGIGREADGASQ